MLFLLLMLYGAVTATASPQPDPPQAVADRMLAATLRMPDMPLHDPWIVADREGGTYYLFTRNDPAGSMRTIVPLGTPISPGDTVLVGERWF